ncbi:hypothetical protein FRB94_011724 [Tulasnella sp. JGI-2019a]|nr:hypothetical protein FRB94_011724 [Tulasnella sp. JGI-2019a]KAG9027725.1 hypothetical protein FRB95_007422 [Tulasnella sp. JGI-2019a]
MFSLTTFALLALSSTVHGLPQVFGGGGTPICLAPIFTGTPPYIFASTPGTRVHNLQLGRSNGTAVLEQSGLNTRMTFEDSQIGVYDGSCTPFDLDIGPVITGKPYRALTWSFAENTGPTWVGNYSETVKIKLGGSTVPAEFLACNETDGVWTLNLKTGAGASAGCVATELEVSANGLHEVGTK